MSPDDRLERIERRLDALEAAVRRLAPAEPRAPVAQQPRERPPPPPPVRPRPSPPPSVAAPATPAAPPARPDAEQWIGQRGLLAVGVVFVILAAAYTLKLAFDRGWISPALRCVGGVVVGLGLGAGGWQLYRRDLKTYGAALIGTGAALMYLALWAAARLYELIPPAAGIPGLAVVSFGLAAVAYRLDEEALGAAAALGVFFAPVVIGAPAETTDVLLLYLAVAGATLGWAGTVRQWRLATGLVALSYFGIGLVGVEDAAAGGALAYTLAGGVAGMVVGLRARWPETRFLAFAGAWGLLAVVADRMDPQWPIVAGAVVLALPIWWWALRSPNIWPDATEGDAASWYVAETLYFYMTPWFVALTLPPLAPDWFARHAGAALCFVAVPYVAAGYARPRIPFTTAGVLGLAGAALLEWSGLPAVWTLLGLAVAVAAGDHVLNRRDGRWFALVLLGGGVLHLGGHDLASRPDGPAFLDGWALTLWAATVATVLLAAGVWRVRADDGAPPEEEAPPRRPTAYRSLRETWMAQGDNMLPWIPAALWALAGLLLFLGVTGELPRLVGRQNLAADTTALVSGLSVSAWWTVFAGGLVMFGFQRALKPVRVAGLLVAGLAVAKVVLVDLSRLDALYRVGSVLTLGVVSLLVAYLYHRQARA